MICENCGKEHNGEYSNRFCSLKCARSFATKNDNKNELKEARCICCGKIIYINKRFNSLKCKCKDCKDKYIHTCKTCGKIFIGTKNQRCCSAECKKINHSKNALIKYFNFNKNVLGTIKVFDEYNKIKNDLNHLYWDDNKSFADICKIYNYSSNPGNLTKIFKQFGLERRNYVDASINAYITGNNHSENTYNYHSKWHNTWDGKEVFLRSSYESNYANKLDEQKIKYEVESLRIKYFNTKLNEYHCAIPDFYLPETNTIVEIKSTWTLDIQEMKDKVKEYKDLGYNFKLILNNLESNIIAE